MSLPRSLFAFGSAALIGIACGGDDSTVAGNPDSSADTSTTPDSSGTSDASGDTGQSPDTGTDTGSPCPDEHGAYTVALSGAGCGDTSMSAPQCVMQSACKINFSSKSPTMAQALNGDPTIGTDGSFSGAAIKEGTVDRTGCIGAWDGSTSTLTVDCGGMGTSQSCVATLKRTSMNCN